MRKLLIISALLTIILTAAYAMGSKPPAKEEPKYKLEILKMEIVPAYTVTPEAKPQKGVK